MRVRSLMMTGAAIAAIMSVPAAAQSTGSGEGTSGTDDIIVTAQRRAERSQDVPITITSLDNEALARANVQQLSDIVKLAPATRFDYQATFVQPSIRGIGNAVVSVGAGSNVGIYMDGFYSPNQMAGDFQLLSVEGIQVLKGPQGTLFGRNTTGGAILVSTAKPQDEFHATFQGSYSRFNTLGFQGYVTAPVADRVSVDLEGSYRRGDGYAKNVYVGGPEHPGKNESWSIRAGLNFEVSDKVSFLLRYLHQDVNDPTQVLGTVFQDGVHAADYYAAQPPAAPGPYAPGDIGEGYREVSIPDNQLSRFRFKSDIFQLTGNFDLGFANLASYTQYRDENADLAEEQDNTAVPIQFNGIPSQNKTFTQELLFTSQPGGSLQWTAGLFYFNAIEQYRYWSQGTSADTQYNVFQPHHRSQTLAAYADVTYEVADNLFLTGGIRYSHDIADRAQIIFPDVSVVPDVPGGSVFTFPDVKTDRVTPRAVVRYQLNDQSSIYASYSRGYKAAFVDVVGAFMGVSPDPTGRIKPEVMDAYEIGYKYASRKFSLSLSGWYYDYKNLQVAYYPYGLSAVANADKARVYGVEGEVHYEILPGLDLNASAAYVDAKYKKFPNGSAFGYDDVRGVWDAITPVDISGFRMQRAPKFTGTLGARYEFDFSGGKMALSGNLYHTSSFFFDPAMQFRQKGYDLVGLRAEWTDATDRYTVAVFGDNVTNEKYYSQVIPHNPSVTAAWASPATWGVSFRVKY